MTDTEDMELFMIYKISPDPSLPSGPATGSESLMAPREALWAGGQRGGKKKQNAPLAYAKILLFFLANNMNPPLSPFLRGQGEFIWSL